MTDTAHARFSPSGAKRWMGCPGSMALEAAYPDSSSSYAAEGTLAHLVASMCLEDGTEPKDFVGKSFDIDGYNFTVDATMAEHVASYMKLVRQYAEGGYLMIEKRVDFSPVIGQPNSFGTSDAIIAHETVLTVIDLKYGMGVKVDAEENPQLMLYGLGALNDYGHLSDFEEVRLVVHQPRLDHVSEWTVSVSDLEKFGNSARMAAAEVLVAIDTHASGTGPGLDQYLRPSGEACKFCRAKPSCPALKTAVADYVSTSATVDEFKAFLTEAEPDAVADLMDKADMAEMLIKAVRAEVERRLLGGKDVRGYKLVEGREGNRAWTDEAKVEELMKKKFRFKDDQVYDFKLISPTTAEKRFSDQKTRWKQLDDLIGRSDGKPSVAPESDKRPALTVASFADEMQALAQEAAE